MSTEHEVRVVRIGEIHKHPEADTLGITEVEGRPCIVKLGIWNPGDLAVYVPIDTMCPLADMRFAFLANNSKNDGFKARVKAMRLRGIFSMGLLVTPDADMIEGEEVSARLDITEYEPSIPLNCHDAEADPGFAPYYDIESARKYAKYMQMGEEVVFTEKIDGENGRFCYHRDRLWVASHGQFKKRDAGSTWWYVAKQLNLEERLKAIPGIVLYGEVFGKNPKMHYGEKNPDLRLFDAYVIEEQRWMDYDEFKALAEKLELATVPELYRGLWLGLSTHAPLAEGNTTMVENGKTHIREGWVCRPVKERRIRHQNPERSDCFSTARMIMKLHGEAYLLAKK